MSNEPTAPPAIQGLPEGYKPGLEGVIAGTSAISEVNPDKDALTYRGYQAHDLARHASFSEVAYLLLNGSLPNKKELTDFRDEIVAERQISNDVLDVLKNLPETGNPMTALMMGVAALQMNDPDGEKIDQKSNLAKAKRLIAKTPTIAAAANRFRRRLKPIPPDPKLSHGANFLNMVTGKAPSDEVARAFDSTMILYMEHGFNASTFSALVTASTLSDMHSAVAAAIGTLKGPLHGGANEKAVETLLEIGDESNVEPWLKEKLSRKEKIMGFGHRVYKKQDSRAPFMKELAELTAKKVGDKKLFPLSVKLEELMKKEKDLFPNVDFHGGLFYYLLGLPIEIYTSIFAISRMAGWTAHIIEQQSANRLIRPKALYTGPRHLTYVPLDQR